MYYDEIVAIGGPVDGKIIKVSEPQNHGYRYIEDLHFKRYEYLYHAQLDRFIYKPHFHQLTTMLFNKQIKKT